MRLFYAITLSDQVRDGVALAQSSLRKAAAGSGVRWTNSGDLHITVLFLGDHPNIRLPEFIEAGNVAAAETSPFELITRSYGTFPDAGPTRVVWVGMSEPPARPATALALRLRQLLPAYALDPKPFRPHITLGYIRPRGEYATLLAALSSADPPGSLALPVHSLALMQTISETERPKSGGNRYNVVRLFPFGGAASL